MGIGADIEDGQQVDIVRLWQLARIRCVRRWRWCRTREVEGGFWLGFWKPRPEGVSHVLVTV